MSTTIEQADLQPLIPEGVTLRVFPNGVVNIDRRDGELVRADVDATRAAFDQLGWREVKSWIPRQGVSWLSGGVTAGVSFRIERKEAVK